MEETKVDMDQEKVNTMINVAMNTVVSELNVEGREISHKERFIGTFNKLKNHQNYKHISRDTRITFIGLKIIKTIYVNQYFH